MDLSAPAILKRLDKFRKTEYFNILILVVLGLVAVGLYSLQQAGEAGVCLAILLTPISLFVIPYWLGERRMKRFALNFIPVFVIAVLLIAAFQTQAVTSQGQPILSSGVAPSTPAADLPALSLWNGTVKPFTAPSANQTYQFHVRLKGQGAGNASRTHVFVNLTRIVGLSEVPAAYPLAVDTSPGFNDTSNGTWYVLWQPLQTGVYGFWFFANDTRGNQTYSSVVLGPLIAPWVDWYGVWLVSSVEYMVYPGSFYFVILFMYWYTGRTRKMRERMIESRRGEKLDLKKEPAEGAGEGAAQAGEATKAEAPAPPRDRSRKAAAFTCTNCGADVSEADTKCPKCGAVFED